jgi:uncharacterized RDD family membrane protein YckC
MNQQIVEYLQANKGQYTRESLVAQLRNAGHSENDIVAAVNVVYIGVSTPPVPGVQTAKYAGFWIRFVAAVVDSIIVAFVGGVVGFIIGFILAAVAGSGSNSLSGSVASSFIGVLIMWTYFVFMTHNFQATLGKKLLGLEVRASDASGKATLGSIILRETIGKLFSTIFYIGYIMAGFTAKKQGLHDMIAKTVVVYKDPQKKSSAAIIVTSIILVVFVMIAIVGIIASIMLISLSSARDKAQDASVKATIASTVPIAILCMDDGSNILSPKENAPICKTDKEHMWPSFDGNGSWGELIDGNVADGTFAYTAYYGDTKVTCTEKMCDFDGKMPNGNYGSTNEVSGNGYESTVGSVGDIGTYADAILTQDVMQGVVAKLSILGCNQYESYEPHIITDIAYTANDVRSWEERWVVSGCGSEYPIDITFTETRGEGTVWTIK